MREPERKPVEHDEPRRKAPYPALSKTSAQARLDARIGTPYVPLSDEAHAGKGKWWVAFALTVALAAGTGAFYFGKSAPANTAAASASTRQKNLPVSEGDVDLELTALARNMLADGTAINEIHEDDQSPASVAHAKPATAAPKIVEPSSAQKVEERKRLVRNILSRATPEVRRQIASGGQAIYRLHLVDDCIEDGDAVVLYANGTSYGKVLLKNKGDAVLVPLPTGALSQMHVLAVEDGGGGVTFGATSSDGAVRSKVMRVGDSDNWTVVPR